MLQHEQQQSYDRQNVHEFLVLRLSQEIVGSEGYQNLCQWTNGSFVQDVQKAQRILNFLNLDVSGGNTSNKTVTFADAIFINDDYNDVRWTTKK